jgi:peroxiredoxin
MTDTVMQNPPQVGDTAPDFTTKSTSGEMVTLSALRGKQNALLAFFPLAFTGVCSAEMKSFNDDYDRFARADVQILPISVDSVDSLKEFKAKLGMKTDFLSDFKRDISRLYGVLLEDRFYSNRAYFLIDKQGIVRWAHVEEKPGQRRENSEILAHIEKLQRAG